MNEKIFQKGIVFENDTCYKAKESRYDIYLEDCVVANDKVYTSSSPRYNDALMVAFLLKNLKNVTLDFGNATVVFHGRITPFIIDGCENVKIINVKVDYDRPFYTQAQVCECSIDRMKIRIDDGFDYRVENGYLYAVSETWEKNLNRNDCLLWLFDRKWEKEYPIMLALFGPEIFPKENPPLPIQQLFVEEEGEYLILKGEFPKGWEANEGNNSLVFTHETREKCTVLFVNSKNVHFENLILIHGAAYGLMGFNTENIYIDNFSTYMNYENNGRVVTNNADGVHLFNCKGDFVLKNSHMEGLMDDTVNIHGNYLSIVAMEGNKIICMNPGADADIYCPMFVKGDRIAVYRGRTQERKGEYTIIDVFGDQETQFFHITLDKAVENLAENDVVENLTGNPNILIENCKFGRLRGTMRLQSRKKTVLRNCEFYNKDTSMLFTGDTTYWFESGPVNDFLIENCAFYNTAHSPRLEFFGEVEYTEKEGYYHKNITVRNCYFDKGLVAVLRHVDNFRFEDNKSDGELSIKEENSKNIYCNQGQKMV